MESTAHPEQKRIYQFMKPEQKLMLAENFYQYARALKAAGLRNQHPDRSGKEIRKKVREIFLYATT